MRYTSILSIPSLFYISFIFFKYLTFFNIYCGLNGRERRITKKKRYVVVSLVLLILLVVYYFSFHKRSLIYLQVSQHLSEVLALIRSLVFVCKYDIKFCRVKFYSMILILVYRFIFYQLSWGILGNKIQRGVNSSTRDLVALRRFGAAVSPNPIGSDFC